MLNRTFHWTLALILVFLILALPACGKTGGQNAPTTVFTGPQLLFEDEFSDETSGWLEATDVEASQGYRNDQLFFEVRAPDLIAWDNPGGNFQDFVLEVEARQVSGALENSLGVLLRYIDDGNFYRFDLTGDGYYAVSKSEYREWNILVDWQESAHVKPLREVNLIKVVCQGPRMTFYVNDQELVSVEDSSFERGDVGLFASTFANPNIEAEFDNLEIWETE